jgi:hypothetical protein
MRSWATSSALSLGARNAGRLRTHIERIFLAQNEREREHERKGNGKCKGNGNGERKGP